MNTINIKLKDNENEIRFERSKNRKDHWLCYTNKLTAFGRLVMRKGSGETPTEAYNNLE